MPRHTSWRGGGNRKANEQRPRHTRNHVYRIATVSKIWGIAEVAEVLKRTGLCTKQDLYDIITEFRRKNPRASIPKTAFPEPYLLTETENKIIDDILELLNKHGLTLHQSFSLLARLVGIIEMGQRLPKWVDHATHALPLTMFADLRQT